MAKGFVIAAPRSGSGKTTLTLGLVAALRRRGYGVQPAKSGPDYIDTSILSRVAGRPAMNLDAWAMAPERLRGLAASDADLLIVEGAMGLFDGAADGAGSTGDVAAALGLPVILVVDAEKQSQSIAPLVAGFANWRSDVRVEGIVVNRVATQRHETMLRNALRQLDLSWLGALPRRDTLVLPERHLGLVLPGEVEGFSAVVDAAARAVTDYLDLDALVALARPPVATKGSGGLAPLGQRIAIARDEAFAFVYEHFLRDWRAAGAELRFFSPLADEAPDAGADAVFLPGGYPELHGGRLAAATGFQEGMRQARDRGALIYGECGGYMVLGRSLTDKQGNVHAMTGLLPVDTAIDRPRRQLGYRRLAHASPLPWPERLYGHEFHYSTARAAGAPPLFAANDALGEPQQPMGAQVGRVLGSYAHVIEGA